MLEAVLGQVSPEDYGQLIGLAHLRLRERHLVFVCERT